MPNVSPQVLVNKITFKLDDFLLQLLTAESVRTSEPMSVVIRRLLEEGLKNA